MEGFGNQNDRIEPKMIVLKTMARPHRVSNVDSSLNLLLEDANDLMALDESKA